MIIGADAGGNLVGCPAVDGRKLAEIIIFPYDELGVAALVFQILGLAADIGVGMDSVPLPHRGIAVHRGVMHHHAALGQLHAATHIRVGPHLDGGMHLRAFLYDGSRMNHTVAIIRAIF